jgi:plastocyanin
MRRVLLSLLVPVLLVGCTDAEVPTVAQPGEPSLSKGPPLAAEMQFGNPDAGSPFPPPSGHDASFHAKDKIIPGTVVISRGGTVTFRVFPVHRVAIYDRGTQPSDISLANLEPAPYLGIPEFQINDPNNRLFLEEEASFVDARTVQYTFTEPGRYLVICVTTPHFVDGKMYGWVIVQ